MGAVDEEIDRDDAILKGFVGSGQYRTWFEEANGAP